MESRIAADKLDLRHLRVFYEVARERSVSRAAARLAVGQPSVSKSIQAFEAELGVILFERHKRGMSLTATGERIFSVAQNVFDRVAEMASLVEEERAELRGDLVVAGNEHVVSYLLPEVVCDLRASHPALIPRLLSGPAHLLLREIIEGRAELGLFFKVESSSLVDRMTLAEVPCQLVVKTGLAREASVVESFIGSREVDDLANRAFPTLDMLRKKRPETRITVSSNSLEAHKALVLRGVGVSILPRFVVHAELARGELEILHPKWVYSASLQLVTRRGKVLSRAAHTLLGLLRRQLKRS